MNEQERLSDLLNNSPTSEELRAYLGLSMIGKSCYRYIQHYHYWTFQTETSQRIKRLLNVGHTAEEVVIEDLRSAGYHISDQQETVKTDIAFWKGHIDGIAYKDGVEYILEIKTHNQKSFDALKKQGVRLSKPEHYAQMTAYSGYMGLPKYLYIALNKNTSEYHIEILEFDGEHFADLQKKEFDIIATDHLFPRIGNNSQKWFECKICDAKEVCFEPKKTVKSCRSCVYVGIDIDDGQWICENYNKVLTVSEQRAGCADYKLGSMLDV